MSTKTWNAQSYYDNSQLQYQASKDFFEGALLSGNETILDIGCGTGLLTSEIAKKVPQGKVIGIDSSENMITYANQHFSASNLEFILMRAENINFPFKFDAIISSFCLHWVKDKQAVFNRIVSHLSPNGSAYLIMVFRHEEIARIRSSLMSQEKWAGYFSSDIVKGLLIFDNQYDHYAKNAGFTEFTFQTEEVTTHFENVLKLKTFLQNITSHLNLLPTERLQGEFMDEVVNAYLKQHPPTRDGACFIKYTYGKIIGKK